MADQDFNIRVVTTADTKGIQQTGDALRKLQQQAQQQDAAAAESAAYEVGRRLRMFAGAGAIGLGYKFLSEIRETISNIGKLTAELTKQGNELTENIKKHAESSKFATTEAEAIKLGESALKDVESTHKRLLDSAGKELTTWQKVVDVWTVGFRGTGPNKAALETEKAAAALNYEAARTGAIQDIAAAKLEMSKRASETYEQTVARLNERLKEQQRLADVHWAQKDVESYLVAAAAVEKYKKEITDLGNAELRRLEARKKAIEDAAYSASPQTKAVLMQEQAERKARAEGREREADLFKKAADDFKRSMTDVQRAELDRIHNIPKEDKDSQTANAVHELKAYLINVWGSG